MTPWRFMYLFTKTGIVISMRFVVTPFVCLSLTTYVGYRWGTVQCRPHECGTVKPITKLDTK